MRKSLNYNKNNNFLKLWTLISKTLMNTWSNKVCESGIAIFSWKVAWNYAHSLFKNKKRLILCFLHFSVSKTVKIFSPIMPFIWQCIANTNGFPQGRIQEFVKRVSNFLFPGGGAQHLLGLVNPLKTIYFTSPGWISLIQAEA